MAWQRFRRDKLAMAGTATLILLVATALAAPLLSRYVIGYTPEQVALGGILQPPGYGTGAGRSTHWLGTDELGRDVLARAIYGGRVSLYVSFLTVLISLTVGTVVGAIAGYYGGWVDTLLMRLVDIMLSIPGLFLLILISVVFRPGVTGLAFVIASLNWMGTSRLVRGEFLSLKARDFVDAATVVGARHRRIIFRHILPNATSPIIVSATLALGGVILTEAALSFLALGVQPPTPSWGNMLTNAQQYLYRAPYLIVIPGFFIFVTVLSGNLMGNGLRDALDPKMRR
ncbi:MAG: ABC transporter permease [Anaerolineae bacterium]|nr:ABC transporter permease [Anaerolineae bacterium]